MMEDSTKDKVTRAVESLPPDASFEDAMERLFILYKVDQGLRQIEAGQGITHDELKRQLKTWHE